MTLRTQIDDELDKLREQFPGWEFWCVLRTVSWPIWCSRPLGCTDGLHTINADTADELAAYVTRAETGEDSCTEDASHGHGTTIRTGPHPGSGAGTGTRTGQGDRLPGDRPGTPAPHPDRAAETARFTPLRRAHRARPARGAACRDGLAPPLTPVSPPPDSCRVARPSRQGTGGPAGSFPAGPPQATNLTVEGVPSMTWWDTWT